MMIKIKKLYNKLRNFILYGIFGVIAVGIDYGIYCVLVYFNIISNISAASILGNIFGFIFTFTANTFLNFNKKDRLTFRFLSYFFICAMGSAFSAFVLGLIKDMINPYIAKILVMGCTSVLQFVLNKLITYKEYNGGQNGC